MQCVLRYGTHTYVPSHCGRPWFRQSGFIGSHGKLHWDPGIHGPVSIMEFRTIWHVKLNTDSEVSRCESYGTGIDIWAIGMLTLFLAAFDWNRVGPLNTYDQDAIQNSLEGVFKDLSDMYMELSEYCKDFVQSCLTLEPSKRITAASCKDHKWFGESMPGLGAQIKELTQNWRRSQLMHNIVADLDLFTPPTTSAVSSNKRKAPGNEEGPLESQESRYFKSRNSSTNKRRKVVTSIPDITLNNDIYPI